MFYVHPYLRKGSELTCVYFSNGLKPPGRKEKHTTYSPYKWPFKSGQITATSAEVTPNVGLVREFPQNARNIQV